MDMVTEALLHNVAATEEQKNDLRRQRIAMVVCSVLKSTSLTVNEMGNILGAITDRICQAALGKWPEYPELEETAHDLAEICENYSLAQDKIDERRCEEGIDSRARKAGW